MGDEKQMKNVDQLSANSADPEGGYFAQHQMATTC